MLIDINAGSIIVEQAHIHRRLKGELMDDHLITTGAEAPSRVGESVTSGTAPKTGANRVAFKGPFKAVCTLAGLFALLFMLILSSISLAAPSSGNSKNLSNTMPDGSPAPDSSGAATFAQPQTASSVPESTGFDYPVGGVAAHEGFEMNNCFSCDWNDYIGHTGEDFDSALTGRRRLCVGNHGARRAGASTLHQAGWSRGGQSLSGRL